MDHFRWFQALRGCTFHGTSIKLKVSCEMMFEHSGGKGNAPKHMPWH